MCRIPQLFAGPASDACTVVSLDTDGNLAFERAMANATRCNVHSFDCARTLPLPSALDPRITLHPVCIGSAPLPATVKGLGVPRVDVLKMVCAAGGCLTLSAAAPCS